MTLKNATPSKVSPMMDEADELWNMGESPYGVDLGGALSPDQLGSLLQMPTYVPLLPTGGWDALPSASSLVHYVGSLRPFPPRVLGPNEESRASFHVVAPDVITTPDVVVAIYTQATFGGTNPQNPHVYPGDPSYYDLVVTGGVGPHVDVVKNNLAKSPVPPYRVVGVQFVPRTSQRPMVSCMQRLRQVRLAVLHLLQQRYGLQEAHVAFAVDCASFGGFTAQLAVLFYPKEFHAGVAGAFSGAHRSMPSDFDAQMFATSLIGAENSSHSYLMRDTVEIPMWCRLEGTDFASISTTNRWALQHMQRPVYFLVGDEDTVTHGTDWVQILLGSGSHQLKQLDHGWIRQRLNVFGVETQILWSVVSKSAHGEARPNVYTLEGVTPPQLTDDLSKPLEVMLDKAYAELIRPIPADIDHPMLGRKLTGSLPSLDPSREALAHKGVRTYAGGSISNLLEENTAFQRNGQGTWLGANESLKVVKLAGDDRASVFVGSADGWVTRLLMQNKGTSPVIQPLVEVARSKKDNLDYALGYGTWGLAVGDIDKSASWPGEEVVVASYNKIALFRASDLQWIREVTLPNWEYDNPRKLQVGDLLDGDEDEIVFRTLHGHLVVMDHLLNIRYEHDEGGVIDMVVGPAPDRGLAPWLKRPIYILSARGHIVRLEIETTPQSPPPPPNARGRLAAASWLEYGGMRDLDLMPWQGQERLAGLFIPHLGSTDAVRFFSPTDCSKVGEFGDLMHDPPPPPPPPPPPALPPAPLPPLAAHHIDSQGDMEPSFTYVAGHGGDRYVIATRGGDVSVWDGEMVLGHKALQAVVENELPRMPFPPAYGLGCIQAGDVDPATPGEEVVISTIAGRVVWFKLSDLTTSGLTLSGSDFVRSTPGHFYPEPGTARLYEHRCNTSLAATWAMAAQPAAGTTAGKLRVIDATGTWWEVSPAGVPTWVDDLRVGVRSLVTAEASSLPNASGGSQHLAWQSAFAGTSGWLFSSPYVPTAGPADPWWLPTGFFRPFVPFRDQHWILPGGGTRIFDAGTNRHWCAYWQRSGKYTNLVQCFSYTVTGGMVDASSIATWGSTQAARPGNAPPPRWLPNSSDYVPPLKTETEGAAPHSMETVKIGRVLAGRSAPQVIAASMGGRLMLLDGDDGKLIVESDDYGLGGMAMAVADLTGDGLDEIVFAPIYNPIDGAGGTVRAHVHVLTGASGTLADIGTGVALGTPGTDFLGYGACGIAVVDFPLHSIERAILVTTLNGELVVFGQTNGVINPAPLFRTIVSGSVGAFDSIVVEDLDPSTPGKEIYIAGSSGIRRFDEQQP
ncbi:MAG: hypothetical protein R3F56_14945 [Planctomycetota bacterium]